MRALFSFLLLALLAGCSNEPATPTTAQAAAALSDAARMIWTIAAAQDRTPIRVDASGRRVTLVASGAPTSAPRSGKPPVVSVSALSDCEPEGDAITCDTAYATDGTPQPSQRVRYWRHGRTWRAQTIR